jgi:hypothetical protein
MMPVMKALFGALFHHRIVEGEAHSIRFQQNSPALPPLARYMARRVDDLIERSDNHSILL